MCVAWYWCCKIQLKYFKSSFLVVKYKTAVVSNNNNAGSSKIYERSAIYKLE